MIFPITNVDYVRDGAIALGADCEHCDTDGATVVMNLYTRAFGQSVQFAEACVDCGRTLAERRGIAEVLVELPLSMKDEVEAALTAVAA